MAKSSKQEAEYVAHSKKNHCDTCANYRVGSCTKVQGAINADGTCGVYYEPKAQGKKK